MLTVHLNGLSQTDKVFWGLGHDHFLFPPFSVAEEKVKDYKYYLRMWAKEKEPKKETIKDLPRMNQVFMIVEDLSSHTSL